MIPASPDFFAIFYESNTEKNREGTNSWIMFICLHLYNVHVLYCIPGSPKTEKEHTIWCVIATVFHIKWDIVIYYLAMWWVLLAYDDTLTLFFSMPVNSRRRLYFIISSTSSTATKVTWMLLATGIELALCFM